MTVSAPAAPARTWRRLGIFLLVAALGAVVAFALWKPEHWRDALSLGGPSSSTTESEEHPHDEHEHEHDEASGDVLELTPQAQRSMNLRLETVALGEYERVITMPGIIAERPGTSRLEITAPLTGVVTKIDIRQGVAVEPGEELFELRLTHEELVQAQADFLRTAEELEVINREVQRLEGLAEQGTIAGKTLLERRYEKQKAEAVLRAQSQALMLHGFSAEQVDEILKTRTLLQFLSVFAPAAEMNAGAETPPTFQVQSLNVERGQHVTAGDTLAELADHETLLIEGTAFERDIAAIHEMTRAGWNFSAVINAESAAPQVVEGLKLEFLDARVDPESRAFHFYVNLPNELLSQPRADKGNFISWKYKPGQRVQLRAPVEKLASRIVLPAAALAKDGLESYVFQQDGDHFHRRAVHVEHEDPSSVVIANDGSIFPGDRVAANGAQQLLIALKNKSGGAIDPHAGHNH